VSGAPPTDHERARAHAELLILDAYRSRIATARTIPNPRRRLASLAAIYNGIGDHLWPASGHADLLEIRDAAYRLAEELHAELFGPRPVTVTTLRTVAGRPTLATIEV